jgi:hypothetical protein
MAKVAADAETGSAPAETPEGRRILISALRNEGPFLLEWLAYHRAIGFDEIIVAHNDCTDGSAELLAALQGIGWVTALDNPVPQGTAPQQAAARRLAASGRIAPGDWVIWLDLDEFLNIHVGDGTVAALTGAMGKAQALLIPWRLFGDSHGAEFRGRFLDPAFRFAAGRDRVENWALKTLFRHGPAVARLDIHRPWLVEGNGWTRADVLTAAGRPMDRRHGPNMRWLSGVNPRSFPRMGLHDAGWDLAQINHYALRSKALYALKRLRGRGYWLEAQNTTKLRHSSHFYATLNLNDVEDVTILRWQDRVGARMAEAGQDPAVARALALVARRLEDNMAEIERDTPPAPRPAEAAGPEQAGLEQAGPEQIGAEPAGPGPADPAQTGQEPPRAAPAAADAALPPAAAKPGTAKPGTGAPAERPAKIPAKAAAKAAAQITPAATAPSAEVSAEAAAEGETVPPPGAAASGSAPAAPEKPPFAPTMWFPDEVKAFVQDRYRAARMILEYGSGGSTAFAARETTARVISVESDRAWAADLRAYLTREGIDRPDVSVRWADIGPTKAWGRPKDTRHWGQYLDYPMLPWLDPGCDPDLVLIDGRFRLACLAVTMLHCRRPVTVLIDDYANRPHYHRAETLLPAAERIGHMVRFEVAPQGWDNAAFLAMLPWFFSAE